MAMREREREIYGALLKSHKSHLTINKLHLRSNDNQHGQRIITPVTRRTTIGA